MCADKLPKDVSAVEWSLPTDAGRLQQLLEVIPDAVLIINPRRETLVCNQALLRIIGWTDLAKVIGKRPGELFRCLREYDHGECGSASFCKYCGASAALAETFNHNTVCSDCTITDIELNVSHFRVWSHPININGENCAIFVLRPLEEQLRRQDTEKKIFANLLNTVSNLNVMLSFDNAGEISATQQQSLRKLIDRMESELRTVNDLLDAESGQMESTRSRTNSLTVLKEAVGFFQAETVAAKQTIVVPDNAEEITFQSDIHLIRRILVNMIRNALEAGGAGDTVTIWSGRQNGEVIFAVTNRHFIKEEVRRHLFQKHFSADDQGGGYGTYTMKLLAEKYLGGRIDYQTDEEKGTVFRLCLPDK